MFSEEVEKVQRSMGLQRVFPPEQLVISWKDFVTECSEGYKFNIYEYDNDLSIRNAIEMVLCSSELKKYSEYFEFKKEIQSIDQSFAKLLSSKLHRNRKTWWEKGVLCNAGSEYENDVKRLGLKT